MDNLEDLFLNDMDNLDIDLDNLDIDLDDDDGNHQVNRLPKRYVRDALNPYDWYRDPEFESRYRFPKEFVLHFILPQIRHRLDHPDNRGLPVAPELQMTMSLRYYSTDDFQKVTADLLGYSQSTACLVIRRVSTALAELFHQYIHFPRTEREQLLNIQEMYVIGGCPHVAAALDGVLVKIACPYLWLGEIFRCRKGYFALNVMAAVGPRGRICNMDVRHPGSVHDQTAFDRSALKYMFERNQIRGILLGDPGYALHRYLLVPIRQPQNQAERVYNNCQRATRNVVEKTFGRWKKKFPVLSRVLLTKLDTTISIICAVAVLWNMHIDLNHSNRWDLENFQIIPEAFGEQPQLGMSGVQYRNQFVIRHFG